MNLEAASGIEKRVQRQDLTLDDQAEIAEAVEFLCKHWLRSLTDVEMKGSSERPTGRVLSCVSGSLGNRSVSS